MKDIILNTPYLSQYLDVRDSYWQSRSCGMTCVQMILEYYGLSDKSLDEMILGGEKDGGYTKSGWLHDYFVKLLNAYGLTAFRKERLDDNDLINLLETSILEENPVILSVVQRLLGRNKFHMVLITGVRYEGDILAGFYYSDPASLNRDELINVYVDKGLLLEYTRGMAIFVSRKNDK